MASDTERVPAAVVHCVREFFRRLSHDGLPVSFGVVFGSQATGEADGQSDIDLLVVSPRFDGVIHREDVHRLWRVAALTRSAVRLLPPLAAAVPPAAASLASAAAVVVAPRAAGPHALATALTATLPATSAPLAPGFADAVGAQAHQPLLLARGQMGPDGE